MQFKSFEPGIEVNGHTVLAVVDGFGMVSSLSKIHFRNADLDEEIDPEKWYPQDNWLKAFQSIAKLHGDNTLFNIGVKIPQNAIFPPWVKDIDTAIQSIDIAYHMNHRKNNKVLFDPENGKIDDGIGNYGYRRIEGESMIISECNNPYPCNFDHGIITTMANKFEPSAKVTHDDSKSCRKNGAESCTYIITW
jgi:hypothetical protein